MKALVFDYSQLLFNYLVGVSAIPVSAVVLFAILDWYDKLDSTYETLKEIKTMAQTKKINDLEVGDVVVVTMKATVTALADTGAVLSSIKFDNKDQTFTTLKTMNLSAIDGPFAGLGGAAVAAANDSIRIFEEGKPWYRRLSLRSLIPSSRRRKGNSKKKD